MELEGTMENKNILIVFLILISVFSSAGCVDMQDNGEKIEETNEDRADTEDAIVNMAILDDRFSQNDSSDESQGPNYLSLDELKDQASFKVILPSYIPEGYEFTHGIIHKSSEGTAQEGVLESANLMYKNHADFISISERIYLDDSFKHNLSHGDEIIMIGEYEAMYTEFTQGHVFIWETEDVEIVLYAISSKEEALKMANSMN